MIIYRKSDSELVIPCGLNTVVCPDPDHELQMKTLDSSTVLQDITPDQGYYGLYRVIVNPYQLDSKTVDASTEVQVVASSKDGLFEVIVNPYTLESKSQTITQNGEYSFTPDEANGLSKVDISVNVADIPAVVQTKSVVYTENGEYSVEPDEGYDGLSHVDVSVNVEIAPELQEKTVNPGVSEITVEPDQGYDGLSSVTVAAIDSSLDPDLSPENIKKDVEIFGVTGTYEGQTINNQTKTVDSSTTIQYVQPDQGYTGLDYVAVNPYTLDSKTVNPSTNSQTVTSDEDGLSSVTVNAVTAEIDPDLVPGNIKKDVDILGVVGTFEGGTLQSKTVDSSTSSQTVTPDVANYGLSSVTVNPYTEENVSDTITQNGQYTYTAQNADTLSEVTIDVSVADIPAVIQTKSIDISANGEYTVTKDAGYDGMSSVDISVNVPIPEPELQTKTVDSSTSSQTVTPDQNYDGLSQVVINPYVLDTSTVNPSTNTQVITSNADGLSQVTVLANSGNRLIRVFNYIDGYFSTDFAVSGYATARVSKPKVTSKTVDSSTVSQTFNPNDESCEYYSGVTVNPYTTETDSSVLTQNGTYTFTPQNADALSQVTIDVSVDGQPINNQNKTVNPSTSQQSITADQGYTGLGTVTFNAVTAAIDPDIVPGNIKNGVEILGVIGTYDPSSEPLLQPKRITATTTFPAVIYPDPGYDGFSEIDIDIQGVDYDCNSVISDSSVQDSSTYNVYAYIDHINIRSKMVDPVVVDASTVQQVIAPTRDAISQVTVNAVDASIDANILPENIRHGVTILGVTGTYTGDEPQPPQITLLEYITSGDSHTEDNQIQLPCNVTNETVIQFTVNWRDDQGGAFIATSARDFNVNEWRTFGYSNNLYSDLGGGIGGNRFYVAETWSAVYQQYGTVEIGVDSSYHIYQKDVSTGITYTSTDTTDFRSIGSYNISYIGSDYTWLREIKVYENGISGGLTYDFVAAKDQNDVPGLYDTVSGVMYYATTGTIIAGPVLS